MSDMVLRKRTASTAGLPEPSSKDPDWFRQKWQAFSAPVDDKTNDGAGDCGATLSYRDSAGTLFPIAGTTTEKEGHAEMNALNVFLRDVCGYNPAKFEEFRSRNKAALEEATKKKTAPVPVLMITCTSKPCCVRCSVVLGALGFVPTPGTSKTSRTMGQTQWSLHPKGVDFLRMFLGLSLSEFDYLSNHIKSRTYS